MDEQTIEQVLDTRNIHTRIHKYLLVAFLGYLISHESYHRAETGIILTQGGHPLDIESVVLVVGVGREIVS